MSELPSRSAFAECLGSVFRIRASAEREEAVELIEVKQLGSDGTREQFSLIFRGGTGEDYLRQQIYQVGHEKLGAMDLFLVPIGPDNEGMLYQAVFT